MNPSGSSLAPESLRADSPLQGVRVLEVAQYIAGPFAGQQLADLGAEVIKIERPGDGDPFRTYVGGKDIPNFGYHYRAYNRNKKSVVLDLQHPAAQDIFRQLAARVDVVLENFRAGVVDRLGIGYEALREINPRLIFCSVAGFSDDGPYRHRPAFDTDRCGGSLHSRLSYLLHGCGACGRARHTRCRIPCIRHALRRRHHCLSARRTGSGVDRTRQGDRTPRNRYGPSLQFALCAPATLV